MSDVEAKDLAATTAVAAAAAATAAATAAALGWPAVDRHAQPGGHVVRLQRN